MLNFRCRLFLNHRWFLLLIAKKEKGNISDDAIRLIARNSEGSVRDSISLLDRALISQSLNNKNLIDEQNVREMLGLADKIKLISLFKEVLLGKEKEALKYLKELIDDGLDAKNFLNWAEVNSSAEKI